MSSRDRCPLCQGPSAPALVARDRNRETTSETFHYNRCTNCGSIFLLDVPKDLGRYYAGDYHRFTPDGTPAWTRDPTLLDGERFRVELLRRHVPGGALIDIGAGPGGFAAAAAKAGYDVTAIEMDERCCEYMRRGLGVRAICSDEPIERLRQLPPARAISLWHVLEHLREPARMLAMAAERLEVGGVLALGVPNPDSLQFRLLRARWPHLDAPRHLCLMPARALIDHGRTLGLRCLTLTTNDPLGLQNNLHGWAYALRRCPANGLAPPAVVRTAGLLATVLRPIERTDHRGAALTLLLQREDGVSRPRADV